MSEEYVMTVDVANMDVNFDPLNSSGDDSAAPEGTDADKGKAQAPKPPAAPKPAGRGNHLYATLRLVRNANAALKACSVVLEVVKCMCMPLKAPAPVRKACLSPLLLSTAY